MPKAMQYSSGAIIYFEGDHDDRIFILQKGVIRLNSVDIETGLTNSEQVKSGEFFGVKSALGHFAREETAHAESDSTVVCLSVQEFENLISTNKPLIMKMLRVFSNQLRQIHKKTESILKYEMPDLETGLLEVAQSFYEDEQYLSAADVYGKFLKRYPNSVRKAEVVQKYTDAKLRSDKIKQMSSFETTVTENSNLAIFNLPAFERFKKTYENGQVIIAEYEPGDSFYMIESGNVQLVKCVNGQKKNLDILRPGEFFGEMAILDKSPRSATCMASGKVECLEFNKENFEVLITGNPQMALILLKLFCKRINDQKRRLKILVINNVSARLAAVFLMLDEMNPPANPTDKERKLPCSIADLAHWAGLSLDATKDEVNKFVERHKIDVYDSYIIVRSIQDMKRMYDLHCSQREG